MTALGSSLSTGCSRKTKSPGTAIKSVKVEGGLLSHTKVEKDDRKGETTEGRDVLTEGTE